RARPHPLPRLPPRAGRAPRLHDARRRLERRRLPPLRTKDPGSVGGVRRAPGNVSGTKRSGSAGFAAVLGAASLFSWGFILVKAAGLPPATTAVWRLLLALLVLLAAAGVTGARWPRLTRTVGLAGVGFGAHQLLYMAASQTTSVAVVTLVAALQPVVV